MRSIKNNSASASSQSAKEAELTAENDRLKQQISELQATARKANLNAENSRLKKQVNKLQSSAREVGLSADNERLKKQVTQLETEEITELRAKIQRMKERVNSSSPGGSPNSVARENQRKVAEKDQLITDLKGYLDHSEGRRRDLQKQLDLANKSKNTDVNAEHQRQISERDQKIKDLTDRLNNSEKRSQDLQQKVDTTVKVRDSPKATDGQDAVSKLQTQLDTVTQERDAAIRSSNILNFVGRPSDNSQRLQDNLDTVTKERDAAVKERDSLKLAQSKNAASQELQNQIETVTRERDSAIKAKEHLQLMQNASTATKELREQLDAVKKERDSALTARDLLRHIHRSNETPLRLQTRVDALTKERDAAVKERDNLKSTRGQNTASKQLQAQVDALTKERNTLRDVRANHERQIHTLTSQIKTGTGERDAALRAKDTTTAAGRSRVSVEAVQRQLSRATIDRISKQREQDRTLRQSGVLRTRLATVTNERDALKQTKPTQASATTNNQDLQGQIDVLNKTLNDTRHTHTQLLKRIAVTKERDTKNYRNEIDHLKRKLAKEKKTGADLMRSSKRIHAPRPPKPDVRDSLNDRTELYLPDQMLTEYQHLISDVFEATSDILISLDDIVDYARSHPATLDKIKAFFKDNMDLVPSSRYPPNRSYSAENYVLLAAIMRFLQQRVFSGGNPYTTAQPDIQQFENVLDGIRKSARASKSRSSAESDLQRMLSPLYCGIFSQTTNLDDLRQKVCRGIATELADLLGFASEFKGPENFIGDMMKVVEPALRLQENILCSDDRYQVLSSLPSDINNSITQANSPSGLEEILESVYMINISNNALIFNWNALEEQFNLPRKPTPTEVQDGMDITSTFNPAFVFTATHTSEVDPISIARQEMLVSWTPPGRGPTGDQRRDPLMALILK